MLQNNGEMHTHYIVDLESYSLLLRPAEIETEIVQFRRMAYSAENAEALSARIQEEMPDQRTETLHAAALVFVYLFKTDQLQTKRWVSEKTQHCFVVDAVSGGVFDFGFGIEASDDNADDAPLGGADGRPTSAAFDLLCRIQPSAQRYIVDEVITPQTLATSEFLNHKKAEDYLYQRGVFGKL